jgi:predicted acylesterase/phospholipase RssA
VVRASIAAPGVFTPSVLEGRLLVDGGLVNPVPVSMCRAFGADIVVAIDLSWGKLGPYRDRRRDIVPQKPAPRGLFARLRGERRHTDQPHIPSIFEVFNTALDIVEQRVARSRFPASPPTCSSRRCCRCSAPWSTTAGKKRSPRGAPPSSAWPRSSSRSSARWRSASA